MPVVVIFSSAILNLQAAGQRAACINSRGEVQFLSPASLGAGSGDDGRAVGAQVPRAPRRAPSSPSRTALPGCHAACRPTRPLQHVGEAFLSIGPLDTPGALVMDG